MNRICNKCGEAVQQYKELCNKCYQRQYRNNYPEKVKSSYIKHRYKTGKQLMTENKTCASFLGVHVAERVLNMVFNDVEIQPFGNPGFDFICNKGKKIDVKSACTRKGKWGKPHWQFHIVKNKIPDYFLCLAFDNRQNLNPLYMWLLPASKFNHLSGTTISTSTIDKWEQYSISVDKVTGCCDILR